MRKVHFLLAFVVAFVMGALTVVLFDNDTPHCPTEDSCRAVFQNGEWHIVEIVP